MPWAALALSVGVLTVLSAFFWWRLMDVVNPLPRDAELDRIEAELDQLETGDHR